MAAGWVACDGSQSPENGSRLCKSGWREWAGMRPWSRNPLRTGLGSASLRWLAVLLDEGYGRNPLRTGLGSAREGLIRRAEARLVVIESQSPENGSRLCKHPLPLALRGQGIHLVAIP